MAIVSLSKLYSGSVITYQIVHEISVNSRASHVNSWYIYDNNDLEVYLDHYNDTSNFQLFNTTELKAYGIELYF